MKKFAPLRSGTQVPKQSSRRQVLGGMAAAGVLATFGAPAWAARKAKPKVVVIGGGFAGASCARLIKSEDRGVDVTLLEPNDTYIACPLSNAVIAGLRELEVQQFGYRGLRAHGIDVLHRRATAVDVERRTVNLDDGRQLPYDRLVVAPGVDLRFDAMPGYTEAAIEAMPHAWKAGEQTLLLRRQLEAMNDGGVVVMSAPANPFRCPPGPYERASLIAHFLKTRKPRSKLILLDAKDVFSKQKLFEAAWKELYPGIIEWVPLSFGGQVVRVEPATRTIVTEFATHRADVANIIPPQRAAAAAAMAGVADQTGWCPVDPVTFESKLRPGVHVLGDAIIAGGMPKSAFAANSQARACAVAVVDLLRDRTPATPKLINTCYSLVAPDYGISIAGVYQPANGLLTDVPGAGGVSPLDAPRSARAQEAVYAEAWFKTITSSVFG
jgi:sulfide dehydrogenase [flavocytochrome c] flavoprotein subunit